MPATSQLDKLISITAISVLSCFRTIRDWFRSFGFCTGASIGHISDDGCNFLAAAQHLEKTDVQADPTGISGKADMAGCKSEDYAQLLHRGSGGSMYTRKAYATREASRRGQR